MPLRLFSSADFSLANLLGFVVGFAMFGGITFLPQLQQYVQGQPATGSGLLLFSTMGLDTPAWLSGIYMAVLGAGMGCMMPTTNLIAQYSVHIKEIGAATGTSTFAPNMGGSLGISVPGSIYASRLVETIGKPGDGGLRRAARSPPRHCTHCRPGPLQTCRHQRHPGRLPPGIDSLCSRSNSGLVYQASPIARVCPHAGGGCRSDRRRTRRLRPGLPGRCFRPGFSRSPCPCHRPRGGGSPWRGTVPSPQRCFRQRPPSPWCVPGCARRACSVGGVLRQGLGGGVPGV